MITAANTLIRRAREGAAAEPSDADGPHNLAGPAPSREALAVLALFVALTILHTWPLAGSLGSLSRHDNGDAMLNEWAVAWVAHQLPRAPLQLFDANIFYPERNTLAFSEHLFVQGVMGAPLLWAGVSTLLVHNLLILAGFALSGWTTALVLRRRTGSWACGILAGMLLAFNSHTLARIAHLQAVHLQFIPLTMFALDRLLTRPRVGNALRLSAMYTLQGLTSNYLLVFMTFGLAGAGLVRVRDWVGRGRLRVFGLICLAAVVAVLLLAPFLIHYLQAQREQGLTRTLAEVGRYAASWEDYLSATGNVHFRTWSAELWRGEGAPLFPGVTATVLTLVALVSGIGWRHPAARMWLALAVVGLVLSFGAALPGYSFLYHAVPLLQGIRASVRFGFLVLVGMAFLSAFGLAVLRTRFEGRPRARLAVTAAALTLVTVEALRIPVPYSPPVETPGAYVVLKEEADAVLLELPLYEPNAFQLNGRYMLFSTVHWRPIVNGYSGFLPRSYHEHLAALRNFPDEASLAYLRRVGVTHVSVHPGGFRHAAGQEQLKAMSAHPGLRAAINSPGLIIYKVRPVVLP
jgi:hypothetical protein